jgi:hypothetical protein
MGHQEGSRKQIRPEKTNLSIDWPTRQNYGLYNCKQQKASKKTGNVNQSEENGLVCHLIRLERPEAVGGAGGRRPRATATAKLPRAMKLTPDAQHIPETFIKHPLACTNLSTLGILACWELAPGDESGKRQGRTRAG